MPSPLLLSALAGGIGLAGQVGNQREINKLRRDTNAGTGLDAKERSTLTNDLMDPARSLAGGVASEAGRAAAGLGAQGGGAALARIRETGARQLGRATSAAGSEIARSNQAALAAKRQELEDRRANRAAAFQDVIGNTIDIYSKDAEMRGEQQGAAPGTFALGGDLDAAGRSTQPKTPAERIAQLANMFPKRSPTRAPSSAITQQLQRMVASGMSPEAAARELGLLPDAAPRPGYSGVSYEGS